MPRGKVKKIGPFVKVSAAPVGAIVVEHSQVPAVDVQEIVHPAQAIEVPRIKYDYLSIVMPFRANPIPQEFLDEHGERGWELVAIHTLGRLNDNRQLIFKRQKEVPW